MNGKIVRLLTLVMVLAMIASPAFASPLDSPVESTAQPPTAAPAAQAAPVFQAAEAAGPALYIVQLQDASLASYTGGIPGLRATSPEATGAPKLDANSPASRAYLSYLEGQQAAAIDSVSALLGRSVDVAFQYLAVLNAFAVTLSPDEAAAVAKLSEVKAVYRDVERELDTDVGPIHIGAPAIWNGNTGTGAATRGEGVVIGMIDSGINHAHPSFAATDGGGYTHINPYGAGVYKGWCATNAGFCNAKLIGAYSFNPNGGNPEDADGHGSHTASTAGGNAHTASFNIGPTPYNIPIQGVAPRANIVAYKVCNPSCPGTASVAAVNSAILNDQVDVLNYSISGADSPWNDPVDLAFLDASNAGIYVSASAGNDGPGASTVAKTGPWNAAVAASTINRVIANTLDVTGPTTPPALQGMAAVPGELTSIVANVTGPIKYNAANSDGCVAFSAGYFTNSLALIQRGGCTFLVKVTNAAAAGAIGVVIFNNVGGPPISMGSLTGTPPAFMLDLANGTALRDYVVANPTATVRVNVATSYLVNNDWEDIVGGFSSRGPSQYELVKPDYIAPGVNTLAAVAAGATPATYAFYQGTSMSSPHGAGAAALMVGLYPSWTPAEVKSALASSATGGLVKENGVTPADPFDVGSGLLALGGASNVGLVFNETGANYLAANPAIGGDPKTLNQPSMANYNCATSCSWTRTVKAVVGRTWNVTTSAPAGMTITVTPNNFTLSAGQTQQLTITANVPGLPLSQFAFGSVTLTPVTAEGQTATSAQSLPVVVKPTNAVPDINVTPTSLAATQPPDTTTSQALTIGNLGTAPLTWNIDEAPVAVRLDVSGEGPAAPDAPISLILDDGTAENGIGIGGTAQFIFVNRFTPSAASFPITLNQIQVFFDADATLNVGDDILLTVYENTSGNADPAVGSNFLASFPATIEALGTWNVYDLAAPVTLNGPGDVLIGVVAQELPGVAYFPAAIDQTASQQRSWAGWWTTAVAPTPPLLPPTSDWTLIDAFFPGNWMVRGYGEGAAACDNPADVPWLTVAPTGGTTPAGGSTGVTVGFDSTGLAVGAYNAVLCVTSNDPATPLVEVPVSLTVGGGGGGQCPAGPEVGELTPNDPVFNRPVGFGASCSLSGVGTAVHYDVYSYNLGGPTPHDLFASLVGGTTMDTVLVFYQAPDGSANPFDPAQGCLNSVAFNDDFGVGLQSQISATGLGAGWIDVVVTTFDNGETGAYTMDVASQSCQGGGDPNIDVDPLSLASTQAPNTTTQQTLDVG
ncbi:MAG TPA: S8 family serine peptidase, partial [Anaerolineae bacterium]|nr:S8 family serine peptidase [Anaerolineae bacterium]